MSRRELEPRSDHDLGAGVRTARPAAVSALALGGPNAVHANRYEPSPFHVLDEMLVGLGLAHERYVFVDLGSGKGRVLGLAARYPWRRVEGVELSAELHAVAEENLGLLDPKHRRCRSVRSILGDAAERPLPPEPSVLYLFNPFAAPVLGRVVERLEEAQARHAAERWVLYHMPVHEEVLARSPALERHSAGRDWVVYRSEGPA